MTTKNDKSPALSRDATLLLRGLVVGKVLTLLVVGGLLYLWLKPRPWVYSSASSPQATGMVTSNFGAVPDVPSGSFDYGGSAAWAPIRQLVDSQLQSDRPEVRLNYLNPTDSSPGSNTGLRMLLNGQLNFAQTTRPLEPEDLAAAKKQGFTLGQRPVAIDGVAVVVNPSLQVPGLTVDQLRQIYRGQITNWRQVGGPDLAITPFSQRPEDGDTLMSSQNGQPSFGSKVQYVYSSTEALREVSKTPGGIYYASARTVVPQCSVKPLPLGEAADQLVPPYRDSLISPEQCPGQRNQVNVKAFQNGSYPLTRKLFVIIKQQGQDQQIGETYAKLLLTDQGQQAIEQAGFAQLTSSAIAQEE